VTTASSKLAKAEEIAALRGLRAAVAHYVDATDALAAERRADAAVAILAEVLAAREKKRGLFGTKDVDPLGPDRAVIGRQFAKLTRLAQINDDVLEVLAQLATEQPDDPGIRLANAEGLYRGGYIADAIDEYRFCEKLIPDDPAIVARLGALYAEAGRGPEAEQYLQRGIGDLMQAQRFDEVPSFALTFLRVAPHAHQEVARWLESLPDESLAGQHEIVGQILDSVREMGLEDARWAGVKARSGALAGYVVQAGSEDMPPQWSARDDFVEDVQTPACETGADAAWEDAGRPDDAVPSSGWHSADVPDTGVRDLADAGAAWSDGADSEESLDVGRQPASPELEPETAPPVEIPCEPAAANGSSSHAPPASEGFTSRVSIGSTQPTAGGGLPPGLAAFTRRKADAAFAAGDFAAAVVGYERLHRASFDPDVAARLAACYESLGRLEDAAALRSEIGDSVSHS
jgi:Flp pilus assembly protein TadD